MSAIKLKENLYSVGVLNPSLRVFDIVNGSALWHKLQRVSDHRREERPGGDR